jgi:expansin
MASSPALALVLLLCIVLLSAPPPPPPVAAAFLFGGGKSAKKPGKAVGLGMEWQPATATWYGEADGDGSDGNPTLTSPP